jgi:hypothetical protein
VLTAKTYPPRVIGNPAVGSAKGSGLAQQEYFKRCVANGGDVGEGRAADEDHEASARQRAENPFGAFGHADLGLPRPRRRA